MFYIITNHFPCFPSFLITSFCFASFHINFLCSRHHSISLLFITITTHHSFLFSIIFQHFYLFSIIHFLLFFIILDSFFSFSPRLRIFPFCIIKVSNTTLCSPSKSISKVMIRINNYNISTIVEEHVYLEMHICFQNSSKTVLAGKASVYTDVECSIG